MNTREKETLEKYMEIFQVCRANRGTWETMWERGWNHWFTQIENLDEWPCNSTVKLPFIYSNIERWVTSVNGVDPKFNVRGRTPEAQKVAHGVRTLLKHTWEINKMRMKFLDFLKQGAIYGTAVGFIPYRYKTKTVKMYLPIFDKYGMPKYDMRSGKLKRSFREVEKIMFNSAAFEPVHIGDVWFYPSTAKDVSEAQGVIIRSYTTLEELYEAKDFDGKKMYKNLSEVASSSQAHEAFSGEFSRENLFSAMGIDTRDELADIEKDRKKDRGRLVVLSFWERDRLIIVADGNFLIYDGPNPYNDKELPVVMYKDVHIPQSLYGAPRWKFYEDVANALDLVYNQVLDHTYGMTNPTFVMKENAIEGRDFRLRPNTVIPLRDVGDDVRKVFQELERKPLDQSIFHIVADMVNITEETSGITKAVKGQTGVAKIATEVISATQSFNSMFAQQSIYLEECSDDIFYKFLERARQFYTDEMIVAIAGEMADDIQEFFISPEHLNLDWIIKTESGSTEPMHSGAQRRQNAMALGELLMTLGQGPAAEYVKMSNVLQHLVREGWDIDFPSQFLKTEEEVQMARYQQLIGAMEQNAQQTIQNGTAKYAGAGNSLSERQAAGGVAGAAATPRVPQGEPGVAGIMPGSEVYPQGYPG